MSKALDHFAISARAFCELVESKSPSSTDLARAMAQLHLAALDLPEATAKTDHPQPAHPAPLPRQSLPIDLYWDVFDPFATPPQEPVANSFYDDIAEMRLDLRRGLDLFDRGFPLAACWHWRFHFQVHWGEHLVGAQRALFLASRS